MTTSLILGPGPTFAVLTMSGILQIIVSLGIPHELFYILSIKTCHRSVKYINKVISSHRLVNNWHRSRSGVNFGCCGMDGVKHLANYGQLGVFHKKYCMQYQLKTCHRSEKKYKKEVISSHFLVNICAGNRSGLIRDRNQIEIRDFLCLFFRFCTRLFIKWFCFVFYIFFYYILFYIFMNLKPIYANVLQNIILVKELKCTVT